VWRRIGAKVGSAVLLFQLLVVGGQIASAANPTSCNDPTPFGWMSPSAAPAVSTVDATMLSELGAAKESAGVNSPAATTDMNRAIAMSASRAFKLNRAPRIPSGSSAPMPLEQACGASGVKRGSLLQQFQNRLVTTAEASDTVSSWTSYGQLGASLDWINHQGQICTPTCQQDPYHVNYYCGPATVSEASTTENVAVSQASAASYMGTQPAPTGTTVSGITSGMQHYVGYPVQGWSYYEWVSEPWNPPYDVTTFKNDVQFDIYRLAMPLAGDGVEVYGFYSNGQPYPHLPGHQITRADSPVYHIFMIGGFDNYSSEIYYADSATSVWTTVQPFNWFDTGTLVTILGGRGYLW
jgi:hypothetical protein